MKSSDNYINSILISTALAIVFSLIVGTVIGFIGGLHFHDLKNGKANVSRCNQYTVLDANHVVTACGDTIQYKWKINVTRNSYGTK